MVCISIDVYLSKNNICKSKSNKDQKMHIIFFITDQSGKVRIWDTVNKEHILKNEFHPIGGPIKDIAWSPDNQRMVVVGEGRER